MGAATPLRTHVRLLGASLVLLLTSSCAIIHPSPEQRMVRQHKALQEALPPQTATQDDVAGRLGRPSQVLQENLQTIWVYNNFSYDASGGAPVPEGKTSVVRYSLVVRFNGERVSDFQEWHIAP